MYNQLNNGEALTAIKRKARTFADNAIVANRIMDLCDQYDLAKIDEPTLVGCIREEFSKHDLIEFVACQYLNGCKFVDLNKN